MFQTTNQLVSWSISYKHTHGYSQGLFFITGIIVVLQELRKKMHRSSTSCGMRADPEPCNAFTWQQRQQRSSTRFFWAVPKKSLPLLKGKKIGKNMINHEIWVFIQSQMNLQVAKWLDNPWISSETLWRIIDFNDNLSSEQGLFTRRHQTLRHFPISNIPLRCGGPSYKLVIIYVTLINKILPIKPSWHWSCWHHIKGAPPLICWPIGEMLPMVKFESQQNCNRKLEPITFKMETTPLICLWPLIWYSSLCVVHWFYHHTSWTICP